MFSELIESVRACALKYRRIPGSTNTSCPEDFDPVQLKKGIAIEREHSKDIRACTEIALSHLRENPDYYRYLKKMEKQMDEKKKKR